jgi:serine/threonine protein kinase
MMDINYDSFIENCLAEKRLGSGINAKTYEIKNDSDKIMKISTAIPLKRIDELRNEINISTIAGNINNGNISPKIFASYIIENVELKTCKLFVIMEKINGKILSTMDEYTKYKNTIMSKYEALLKKNISHNDELPQNIMIGKKNGNDEEDVYFIDYGDASLIKEMTDNDIEKKKESLDKELTHFLAPSLQHSTQKPVVKLSVAEQRMRAKEHSRKITRKNFKERMLKRNIKMAHIQRLSYTNTKKINKSKVHSI